MQVMAATGSYLDAEWEPQRPQPVSPWPVDIAHLARYTIGDKALEREVLGLFVAELPRRIEAMREARSDKDWKMAAHTLKGSSRAVGAWRIAHLAQQAEQLSVLTDVAACDVAVLRLAEAAAEAEAYIARLERETQAGPLRRSA
jgi:HPt (histidine-containing phosphotransfer) domain-containing protein